MSAPLMPLLVGAAAGSVAPALTSVNHNYTSANNTSECAIIIKTDGWVYELDGVTEIQRFKWITPPHKGSYTDVSFYLLSVGMETGDTVGTWHQVGGSGGGQIKFGITSAGFTRNNTLYVSWGVRSGTTLGAFDQSVTSTLNVPA